MSEALLKTLELMSKLRLHVKDMETSFYSMLQVDQHTHSHTPADWRSDAFPVRMAQDQRMVTPLSLALTSHHRELVQRGLSLLQEATPLPHFPLLLSVPSLMLASFLCPRSLFWSTPLFLGWGEASLPITRTDRGRRSCPVHVLQRRKRPLPPCWTPATPVGASTVWVKSYRILWR